MVVFDSLHVLQMGYGFFRGKMGIDIDVADRVYRKNSRIIVFFSNETSAMISDNFGLDP